MIDSEQKMNYEFMTLRCIGMVLVMCGHFSCSLLDWGGLYDYDTFHIPLFIFMSGYFYKVENHKDISSVVGYIKKKIIHLVLPYFLWNMVYGIFAYIMFRAWEFRICPEEYFYDLSFLKRIFQYADGFGYNVAGWFVMALVLVEFINIIIRYILDKIKVGRYELLIIALYFGIAYLAIVISQSGWQSEWKITITRTGYLLFYYGLGRFYRMYLEASFNKTDNSVAVLTNIFLTALLISYYGNNVPICYGMWWFVNEVPRMYYFVRAILGIFLWVRIAKIITPQVKNSRLVKYYSNHTFSLMMHQGIAGVMFNVFIIKGFDRYEFWDGVKTNIWTNTLIGTAACVLLPITISVVILCCVYIYDSGTNLLCKSFDSRRMKNES